MRFVLENVGPIRSAEIELADLTVFVGPQATGKSIALQLLKLLIDTGAVHDSLTRYGMAWGNDCAKFLGAFFGEGMENVIHARSRMWLGGDEHRLSALAHKGNRAKDELMFFIPAQRVLSLAPGWLRPFSDYRLGDPFVIRDFSEKVRIVAETELDVDADVFPQDGRFKEAIRQDLSENIFAGYRLRIEQQLSQRRFVLARGQESRLPFTVWSAGQREFAPLLLGFYNLLPRAARSRRERLEWAVIEEPEMGLHPRAIQSVMLLLLDLLSRDYRVCVSTHSPHVIELLWALRVLRTHEGTVNDVLDLLELPATSPSKRLAESALKKLVHVYYFGRDGGSTDISPLDPGASNPAEVGWGGLAEFSGRAGAVVSDVVSRLERAGR